MAPSPSKMMACHCAYDITAAPHISEQERDKWKSDSANKVNDALRKAEAKTKKVVKSG